MQNLPFPRAAVGLLIACITIAGLSGCMRTTDDGRVGGGISLGDSASGGYVTPIDVVTGRYEVTAQEYIFGKGPQTLVWNFTKTSADTLTFQSEGDGDIWNCDYDDELASASCTPATDSEVEMPMQIEWSTQDDKRHLISGSATVTLEAETYTALEFEGIRIVE